LCRWWQHEGPASEQRGLRGTVGTQLQVSWQHAHEVGSQRGQPRQLGVDLDDPVTKLGGLAWAVAGIAYGEQVRDLSQP